MLGQVKFHKMEITYDQYQSAKKIVDEYEEWLRYSEELEDSDDDDTNCEEDDEQERFERSCTCICGAWKIKEGYALQIGDCCCS